MITDEEFVRISSYLKNRCGIDMSQKKVIMNGRLGNYISRGGWRNFTEYMDAVERDRSGELTETLINLLTTNHTFFMREFEHLDYLKEVVLPELRIKEAARKDLRIWCGASSTGEEPYMIAMVLKDFFGLEHSQWDTTVLATDISTKVLRKAVAGVYTAEQLKAVPDPWKRKFFKKMAGGTQYKVKDELRREVIFREFNLMNPFPFKKRMHVVFLRNVMIYFDEATKAELIQKVYDFTEPGGYLFIGTTETLDRDTTPFRFIQPSIYRK